MPAQKTDPASAVDTLDRCVRIVRADAEARKQLAVRAAFVGALASTTPDIVRRPNDKHNWTPEKLALLAKATTDRLQSKDELHCVVGVSDFSVNVSYKKKSLVYLTADIVPALRVLTYASLPAPKDEFVEPGSDESGEAERVEKPSDAKIVPSPNNDENKNQIEVALRALDDDNETSSSKKEKEQLAVTRSARLRQLLAMKSGTHWHVAHDFSVNSFGVAPAGNKTNKNTSLMTFEKEKVMYIAWKHSTPELSLLESLGIVAADGASLRLARRTFLFVTGLYSVWFSQMCGEDYEISKSGKKSDGVLSSVETPLTEQLCVLAPKLAPFALITLMMMGGNYAMQLARRVGARVQGKKVGHKRKVV